MVGALTALLAVEHEMVLATGYSGFILELPKGTAIVIMAHEAREIELTIRTQGQANAVLFSLMGANSSTRIG